MLRYRPSLEFSPVTSPFLSKELVPYKSERSSVSQRLPYDDPGYSLAEYHETTSDSTSRLQSLLNFVRWANERDRASVTLDCFLQQVQDEQDKVEAVLEEQTADAAAAFVDSLVRSAAGNEDQVCSAMDDAHNGWGHDTYLKETPACGEGCEDTTSGVIAPHIAQGSSSPYRAETEIITPSRYFPNCAESLEEVPTQCQKSAEELDTPHIERKAQVTPRAYDRNFEDMQTRDSSYENMGLNTSVVRVNLPALSPSYPTTSRLALIDTFRKGMDRYDDSKVVKSPWPDANVGIGQKDEARAKVTTGADYEVSKKNINADTNLQKYTLDTQVKETVSRLMVRKKDAAPHTSPDHFLSLLDLVRKK